MKIWIDIRKLTLLLTATALVVCLSVSIGLTKLSSLYTSAALKEIVEHGVNMLKLLSEYKTCPSHIPPDIQELLIMEGEHIICIKGQALSLKYLITHTGVIVQSNTITISLNDGKKIMILSFNYSLSAHNRFYKIYIKDSPNAIFRLLGTTTDLLGTKFYILSIPYGGVSATIILSAILTLIAIVGIKSTAERVNRQLQERIFLPIQTAVSRLCNTACRHTPLNPKIPEELRVLITIASYGETRLAKLLKLMKSAKYQKLEEFFQNHIGTIVDILNADGGSVMMKKDGKYEIISHIGIPEENIAYISHLLKNGEELWSIRVLENSKDIKYIQTTENPLFIHPDSGFKTITWLGIPITIDDETVAIINIDYTSEVKIGHADILTARLVKAFIENNTSFYRELSNALMNLHRDYLTGLPDRKIAENIIRRLQMEGKRFGIIFLDLDNFSTINDTLGHRAGDSILREITEAIKQSIRKEDTATRYGGDEFLIIINASNRETVEKIAKRILNQIKKIHPEISGSIGMVLVSPDMEPSKAIEKADKAMYRAKDKGGNTAEWGG